MKTYYTHSGLFHADEVAGFAITFLANICNEVKRIQFKDGDSLPTDGIVADIGKQYFPEDNLFDHHQGLILRDNGIPYASAGLLWKHFGEKCVLNLLPHTEYVKEVVQKVDEVLIQGLDAHDTDNTYSVEAICSGGKINILTLSNIISTFNHFDITHTNKQLEQFYLASSLIQHVLETTIINCEQRIVDYAEFKDNIEIQDNILILNSYINWKEIVHKEYPEIDFVIQPSAHPGNPYSMIAVILEPNSRIVRIPIKRPDWFTGFIHQGEWIAGGESIEQLIKLAKFNTK